MKHKTAFIFALGVLFYVFSSLMLPILTSKVAAQSTLNGSFIDHSTISIPAQNGYPGGTFFDNKIDRWLHYTIQGQSFQDNCTQQDFIALGPNKDGGVDYGANISYASQGHIYIHTANPNNYGACSETEYSLNLNNTNNFEAFFVWKDSNTIGRSDGNPDIIFNGNALDPQGNAIPGGQNGTFTHYATADHGIVTETCVSQLNLAGGKIGATNSSLIASDIDLANMQQGWPNQIAGLKATQTASTIGTCIGQTPLIPNVLIADPIGPNGKPASTNAATPPPELNTPGSNGPGSNSPTCESSGFSLSWIFCPIVNGLASAVDGIYSDVVQPLLITRPIDLTGDPNQDRTQVYAIWSSFRVIGDIFLVITLLVVVFGESIGGGLIDAYAAKKILPRLLAAAILINLSIYIVAAAVDITNVIGAGIINLIEAPFKATNTFKLQLNGGAAGIGLGLTAIVGAAGAAFVAGGALFEFLFAFVLLPALLIMLAIVVTVLLRRGLIILLIILAPVAFALYCLPNTEKYFKQWWDLLIKTLLVYPIIAAMFGIANILSVTISDSGQTSGVVSTVSSLMGVIALFVPLFLIPFSFKLAGGAIGKLHEVLNGSAKRAHQGILGNANDPWSLRSRARYGMADRSTQLRERGVNWGKGGRGVAGTGRRAFGRALNYGNLQSRRSRFNKERMEVVEGQAATGDDSNFRDLFIAWDADAIRGYDKKGNALRGGWYRRMDMERGEDGQLHAVEGAKHVYDDFYAGRMAHSKSLSLYGGDKSSIQSALYYEWKKTGFDETQIGRVRDDYSSLLREVGLNGKEGQEMATAVGFRHAPSALASKYTTYDPTTKTWKYDDLGLTKEFAHQIDTYGASKQDVETYDMLGDAYDRMSAAIATDAVDARGVFTDGHYKGRSRDDVRLAQHTLTEIARSVNPGERAQGGRVINAPQDDHGGGGEGPLMTGFSGIANAPVAVQHAAKRFVDRVAGAPPAPPAPPAAP
ncbi:MAG TPA: hypothetical protein VFN56_03120 [Candidatus Saccharimonadales bacterium]|nr:hypothetical protein [Candidatus Saccharimonadales bacterium]